MFHVELLKDVKVVNQVKILILGIKKSMIITKSYINVPGVSM